MRKVLVKALIVGVLVIGALATGIAMSFIREANEANVVMSYQEFSIFEEKIWDIYMEEYCVNECEACDSYYYKECMCDSCELGNECYECLHADYEIFIADNYDYIMSIADDLLEEIQEIIEEANRVVLVYYEF